MAKREWTLEQVIVASETVMYMAEIEQETGNLITLEKAYEDKGVSKKMQLSKEEIQQIISEYLSVSQN